MTELVSRLVDPGDLTVDVGANLGYFAGLMAVRSGSLGSVYAFEPHPQICAALEAHIIRWGHLKDVADIRVFKMAISNSDGRAWLREPSEGLDWNSGLASLVRPAEQAGQAYLVETGRLDVILGQMTIGLAKIDVEGAEMTVFEGAQDLLKTKLIRDLVFETFEPYPGKCHEFLEGMGYTVFHIEPHLFGPQLRATLFGYRHRKNSAPNYLATVNPQRALAKFQNRGWHCLRKQQDRR